MTDKVAEIKIREELGESGGWDEKREERFLDTSTGAYNRDALNLWGQNEIDVASRMKVPLTVVMFDIDKFKDVNDTVGHLKTDDLLKKTIGELKVSLRKTDLLFRYGGDEFVIFLLNCDLNDAEKNILPEVNKVFSNNKLTISAGVQEIKYDTKLENVLEIVDQELYKLKKQKNG